MQCICEVFGLTLAQFFMEDESIEILSKTEKALISNFRKLTNSKQIALINLLNR